MNKITCFSVFLIVAVILTSFLYQQQLENRQKDELVTLVDQAVQMINEKGESAFPELRSSSWFHNDSYVFVWRLDGIRVVYPPDPTGEGKNMTDLVDSNGKPIGKLFIQTAQSGSGWVEYMWPEPGDETPYKKITYIKRAKYKNQTYLVGSGVYI
ncbi:MAG: cache domain-containing protein [Methanobacterium sp.]|jgi:methyl-accepting chemotaxis protein|nr:cache domain-containing protein [Methanobacterium sp.]